MKNKIIKYKQVLCNCKYSYKIIVYELLALHNLHLLVSNIQPFNKISKCNDLLEDLSYGISF